MSPASSGFAGLIFIALGEMEFELFTVGVNNRDLDNNKNDELPMAANTVTDDPEDVYEAEVLDAPVVSSAPRQIEPHKNKVNSSFSQ